MPKPVYNDNGSGMHVHQSIWSKNNSLFAGKGYSVYPKLAFIILEGLLSMQKLLTLFQMPLQIVTKD